VTSLAARVNVYVLGNEYALYEVTADGFDEGGFRHLVSRHFGTSPHDQTNFGVCLVSITREHQRDQRYPGVRQGIRAKFDNSTRYADLIDVK
jgi:hypothetical protein